MVIIIDDIPPSNNKFLGNSNSYHIYGELKKEWAWKIRAAIAGKQKETFERAVVHIHYIFPDRRRRDPDNYCGKMILDPLVAEGILHDDSFDYIKLALSAEYQKGVTLTVITITEDKR